MKPLALLVEDNENSLRRRAEIFSSIGISVITAKSVEEADWQIKTSPDVDLLICDINLNVEDEDDEGGIEIAQKIRKENSLLPMVAYTGRISKGQLESKLLSTSNPFTFHYSKGARERFQEDITKWRNAAITYRQSRRDNFETLWNKIVEKYKISDFDSSRIKTFLPGNKNKSEYSPDADKPTISSTFDSAINLESQLAAAGFSLHIIYNSNNNANGRDEDFYFDKVSKPFLIWARKWENEIVDVEVFQHNSLSASGINLENAVKKLYALMVDISKSNKIYTKEIPVIDIDFAKSTIGK